MAPTTITISLHPQEMIPVARAARELGLPLHSHMCETVSYIEHCREGFGMLPIEVCAEHEWLGPDVWFAHLVHLAESERQLLARSGTGIAHCPQSNGRLGSGVAPAPALARAGVPVTLGVDGAASNEAADMLSEMHHAWLVHRSHAGAAARARPEGGGEHGADVTTVEQVVHWASGAGAALLGFDGVGTLAPGQAADLAVWNLDDPRYFGLHDIGHRAGRQRRAAAPAVAARRTGASSSRTTRSPAWTWPNCAPRRAPRWPGLQPASDRGRAAAADRRHQRRIRLRLRTAPVAAAGPARRRGASGAEPGRAADHGLRNRQQAG